MKTQRKCGDCTLCCRLLPTNEVDSKANEKCRHQCRNGCAVYAARPLSCQVWSCRWLLGDDTGQRPDRAHYVVDSLPDYIVARDNATGEERTFPVVQVWADPEHFDDVVRDVALRAFIEREGQEWGTCGLIRDGSSSACFMAPPSVTRAGWVVYPKHELAGGKPHDLHDVAAKLGGLNLVIEIGS